MSTKMEIKHSATGHTIMIVAVTIMLHMPIAALLPDTEKSPPIASTRLFHQHQNDYESLQGFIQVYHVEIDTWSFVDSSDWNYSDAMVACKELGYMGVAQVSFGTTEVTGSSLPTVITAGLSCTGSEMRLVNCLRNVAVSSSYFATAMPGGVPYSNVGRVSCTSFKTVQLNNHGSSGTKGRVEVFYNNSWGTVCGDYWNLRDADVVCMEMGYYAGALAIAGSTMFGGGAVHQPIWIDDTHCVGTEASVFLCPSAPRGENDCSHLNDVGIICTTKTGSWPCPALPRIANGITIDQDHIMIGEEVHYTCRSGFTLLGSSAINCSWNAQPPICVQAVSHAMESSVVSCPEFPHIAHGKISKRNDSTQSSVTVQCEEGYNLVGFSTLTCTALGYWSSVPPICAENLPNSCSPLPNTDFVQLTTTARAVGTVVTFTCQPGYILVGFQSIMCAQRSGSSPMWNGPPPMCYDLSSSDQKNVLRMSALLESHPFQSQNSSSSSGGVNVLKAALFSVLAGLLIIAAAITIVTVLLLRCSRSRSSQCPQSTGVFTELSLPLVENTAADEDRV